MDSSIRNDSTPIPLVIYVHLPSQTVLACTEPLGKIRLPCRDVGGPLDADRIPMDVLLHAKSMDGIRIVEHPKLLRTLMDDIQNDQRGIAWLRVCNEIVCIVDNSWVVIQSVPALYAPLPFEQPN